MSKDDVKTLNDDLAELTGGACSLTEDSRIIIRDGKVIIENLSEDLLDLALALNPNEKDLEVRRSRRETPKTTTDETDEVNVASS